MPNDANPYSTHFSHTDTNAASFDWSVFLSDVLYSAYTTPYIWIEIQESMREVSSLIQLIDSDIQRSQSRSSTSWFNFSNNANNMRNNANNTTTSNTTNQDLEQSFSNTKTLTTLKKSKKTKLKTSNKDKYYYSLFSILDQLDSSEGLRSYIESQALCSSDVLAASAVLTRESSTISDLEELLSRYNLVLDMLKSLSGYFDLIVPEHFRKAYAINPVMAKAECDRTEALIEGTCELFLTQGVYTISSHTILLRKHPDWPTMSSIVASLEDNDDKTSFTYMSSSLRQLSTKLFVNIPSVFDYLMGDAHDTNLNSLLTGFMYPVKPKTKIKNSFKTQE